MGRGGRAQLNDAGAKAAGRRLPVRVAVSGRRRMGNNQIIMIIKIIIIIVILARARTFETNIVCVNDASDVRCVRGRRRDGHGPFGANTTAMIGHGSQQQHCRGDGDDVGSSGRRRRRRRARAARDRLHALTDAHARGDRVQTRPTNPDARTARRVLPSAPISADLSIDLRRLRDRRAALSYNPHGRGLYERDAPRHHPLPVGTSAEGKVLIQGWSRARGRAPCGRSFVTRAAPGNDVYSQYL